MNDDRTFDEFSYDSLAMLRAIQIAYEGQGLVEPNPMVGCVVVKDFNVIAEGCHERFGGPHAEVQAINRLDAATVQGSTLYVTLEPCAHFGKTPPCVDLIIERKPRRVVIGTEDPFPAVAGTGIEALRKNGITVDVGIEREACERLVAPYLKRQRAGLPWVIAKWAMTLDGRMATRTGDSKWITQESTREHAHQTRGRVDAICVGIETALRDDPMLTARPTGQRIATRVVFDSRARLLETSQLVQTAREFPTMICCGPLAASSAIERLRGLGCEVWCDESTTSDERLRSVFKELARRGHTNILVDGGPTLIGGLFDQQLIDETHVYIATKLVGGTPNHVPISGRGIEWMRQAIPLKNVHNKGIGGDWFFQGDCDWLAKPT